MLSRSLLLAFLAASCHSQYQMENDLRADISFNADNDRFDVGNIINAQNQQFQDNASPMESFRRSLQPLAEVLQQERRNYQRVYKKSLRRMDDDFAYHDLMLSDRDNIYGEYNKNLDLFRRLTQKSSRRNGANHKGGLPRSRKSGVHFMYNNLNKKGNKPVKEQRKSLFQGLQDVVLNYLHGGKETRRRRRTDANLENEILLHYAVPLRMKVKGFLELPQGA